MPNKLATFLWFDDQAEEAAKFYTSVFKNSQMGDIAYYPKSSEEVSGKPAGSVMTVEFELEGQPFVALNGGPSFKFDEAVSMMIYCDTQEDVDYYWEQLTADGGEESACGWLKDKFGFSWQITPRMLMELNKDPEKVDRVMACMMTMRKLNIAELQRAADEA